MNNMRGQKMSTRTFNKPKNKKKTLKRLGNYISEFKGWFILAITLTIISNLFSLVGPLLSGYAIEAIEPGAHKVEFDKVYFYAGLMIVFYLASTILNFILTFLMVKISKKIVYKLRKDCFDNLMMLPVAYFDHNL